MVNVKHHINTETTLCPAIWRHCDTELDTKNTTLGEKNIFRNCLYFWRGKFKYLYRPKKKHLLSWCVSLVLYLKFSIWNKVFWCFEVSMIFPFTIKTIMKFEVYFLHPHKILMNKYPLLIDWLLFQKHRRIMTLLECF